MFKKATIIVVIILLYWIVSVFFVAIPSLSSLLRSAFNIFTEHEIYIYMLSSIGRILVWVLLWITVWIMTSFVAYKSTFFRDILMAIIEIARPIPPIAWIPLSIIFFWTGNISSYFIVFLWCYFPIFSAVYHWFLRLPKIIAHTSASFWIHWIRFNTKVLFPYALPDLFTWIRMGIWTWWMSVIAAEMVSNNSWLGYFIQISRLNLNIENVIIWMAVIWLLWLTLGLIASACEKIFIPWKNL